jgi:beta-galactosidase
MLRLAFCILFVLQFCLYEFVYPQTNAYYINADVPAKKIYRDHLKLGGTNIKGEKLTVNNYYVSFNNKPIIPITAEFHYCRYPKQYWEESIKKMKAGGINVIATYVFWNVHQERENKFDWEGDKNLREFILLCAKHNINNIVRIGPFAHGEIRNGGLPDWLLGMALNVRSNEQAYLNYVNKFYTEIAKQLKGLYFKNNGPIIGIQIENEFQHSAAPWGLTYPGQPHDWTVAEQDYKITQQGVGISNEANPFASLGNDHLKVLKSLAIKTGMDVPLYTATGWGNAAIIPNESIPVTAAYAYPFWTPKRDISPFFLYKDMHKNPDYAPVRYKPEDYPAFPAELGSGIMSVYTRRPIAEHKSFDAMINRCLGSGANGLGYYMFHGGSTPKGKDFYFSDEAYGLPKISYDFQAPIGEYGQVREGFHRLKLLHFFMNDFAADLAPMATILPQNNSSIKPENITDLRYAVRAKDDAGFLFVNNFQDDTITTNKKNIQLNIKTSTQTITIPSKGGFAVPSGENVIFPFNLNMGGINLQYATAQLLAKGNDEANPYYVFFSHQQNAATFYFNNADSVVTSNSTIDIDKQANRFLITCNDSATLFTVYNNTKKVTILVVTKEQALKSYVVSIKGKKHLLFTDAVVLQQNNQLQLLAKGFNTFDVKIYPKVHSNATLSTGTLTKTNSTIFTEYTITLPQVNLPIGTKNIGQKRVAVTMPTSLQQLNDIILTVDYTGDTGMGFLNGELVTDEFYKGIPWEIGLKRFIPFTKSKEMVFYFRPMQKNASYLLDLEPYPGAIPEFGNKKEYLKINNIYFTPEYKTIIYFSK